ncbi:MAG: adenylate/guanylate cyclase domain-containing protein [Chloroflexi bacterium]|nr:MAG: adenylate/guanylate cyclase domain-containing protein [Chloroflexota bacterium]
MGIDGMPPSPAPSERTPPPSEETPGPNEGLWRAILLGTEPRYARTRSWLKHVPSHPRCKMCAAPFGGPGRHLMRFIGRERWSKNPKYCGNCFQELKTHHGGAEIEASFLFADVRGSTALAEQMSPTQFRDVLDRFYDTSARILVDHDAIVDKFVGDEVIGVFIPALAGDAHAARAIAAGLALLKATGHAATAGPWIPIGAGIHSGVAFVGSVGEPPVTEFTALGDVVNTTARLASAAEMGQALISEAAARAGGLDTARLERRELELKGKRESTAVWVATTKS